MINSSEIKNKKNREISHVSRSEALDVKSRHLNWRDICYGTICLKSQFKLNYRIIDASVHSMCIQYTVYVYWRRYVVPSFSFACLYAG